VEAAEVSISVSLPAAILDTTKRRIAEFSVLDCTVQSPGTVISVVPPNEANTNKISPATIPPGIVTVWLVAVERVEVAVPNTVGNEAMFIH